MIGVSFQPGSEQNGQSPNGGSKPSSGSGVQEAIRILSLRLPRVLGAQGVAPMPLLTSQGSGGNPRVDQIVNQVLARAGMGSPSPMRTEGPSFSGAAPSQFPTQAPWSPSPGYTPRVIVDTGNWGDTMIGPDGRPLSGSGPGLIAPLPPNFQAPTPSPTPNPVFGDIGKSLGEYPSPSYEGPFEPLI